MIWVYVTLTTICVVLWVVSKIVVVSSPKVNAAYSKPFLAAAVLIYKWACLIEKNVFSHRFVKRAIPDKKISSDLQRLNPGDNSDSQLYSFKLEKISLALLLVFTGSVRGMSSLMKVDNKGVFADLMATKEEEAGIVYETLRADEIDWATDLLSTQGKFGNYAQPIGLEYFKGESEDDEVWGPIGNRQNLVDYANFSDLMTVYIEDATHKGMFASSKWLNSTGSRRYVFTVGTGHSYDPNYNYDYKQTSSFEEWMSGLWKGDFEIDNKHGLLGPVPFENAYTAEEHKLHTSNAYKMISVIDGGILVEFRGKPTLGMTSNVAPITAMATIFFDNESDFDDDGGWRSWISSFNSSFEAMRSKYYIWTKTTKIGNFVSKNLLGKIEGISETGDIEEYCYPLFMYSHTVERYLSMYLFPTKYTLEKEMDSGLTNPTADDLEKTDVLAYRGTYLEEGGTAVSNGHIGATKEGGIGFTGYTPSDPDLKTLRETENIENINGADYNVCNPNINNGYGCTTSYNFFYKYDNLEELHYSWPAGEGHTGDADSGIAWNVSNKVSAWISPDGFPSIIDELDHGEIFNDDGNPEDKYVTRTKEERGHNGACPIPEADDLWRVRFLPKSDDNPMGISKGACFQPEYNHKKGQEAYAEILDNRGTKATLLNEGGCWSDDESYPFRGSGEVELTATTMDDLQLLLDEYYKSPDGCRFEEGFLGVLDDSLKDSYFVEIYGDEDDCSDYMDVYTTNGGKRWYLLIYNCDITTNTHLQISNGVASTVIDGYTAKLNWRRLRIKHTCDGEHKGYYCGGHIVCRLRGIVYGFSEEQMSMEKALTDTKVEASSEVYNPSKKEVWLNIANRASWLKNMKGFAIGQALSFLLQDNNNYEFVANHEAINEAEDLFDIDLAISRRSGLYMDTWVSWIDENINRACALLKADWEDMYGVEDKGFTVNGTMQFEERKPNYNDDRENNKKTEWEEYFDNIEINGYKYYDLTAKSEQKLTGDVEGSGLAHVNLETDELEALYMFKHIRKAFGYVGEVGYSQDYHGSHPVEQYYLTDCSGFVSNIWGDLLQDIQSTYSFEADFALKNFADGGIEPGDIMLYLADGETSIHSNHALLYVGTMGTDWYFVDCTAGLGDDTSTSLATVNYSLAYSNVLSGMVRYDFRSKAQCMDCKYLDMSELLEQKYPGEDARKKFMQEFDMDKDYILGHFSPGLTEFRKMTDETISWDGSGDDPGPDWDPNPDPAPLPDGIASILNSGFSPSEIQQRINDYCASAGLNASNYIVKTITADGRSYTFVTERQNGAWSSVVASSGSSMSGAGCMWFAVASGITNMKGTLFGVEHMLDALGYNVTTSNGKVLIPGGSLPYIGQNSAGSYADGTPCTVQALYSKFGLNATSVSALDPETNFEGGCMYTVHVTGDGNRKFSSSGEHWFNVVGYDGNTKSYIITNGGGQYKGITRVPAEEFDTVELNRIYKITR